MVTSQSVKRRKAIETHIAHNPVARFYIQSSNICHANDYKSDDIVVREEKESYCVA